MTLTVPVHLCPIWAWGNHHSGFLDPQTPAVHVPSPPSSLTSQPAPQHSAHTISHPSSYSLLQPLKITAKQVLYKHHPRSHKSPPGNLTEVLTLLAW